MTKSIGEITASLAVADKAVLPKGPLNPGLPPTPEASADFVTPDRRSFSVAGRRDDAKRKLTAKKKRPSPAEIEEMLLRFLKGDEEGSASRLAAAKILLERLSAASGENDDAKKREREERAEAETEAQAVLAELSAAKLAGISLSSAVDTDGASRATDAAGTRGQ